MRVEAHRAVYVISVAAELAGMHPQTLRQYDRMGLVTPARTAGRGRRYSQHDVEKLRLIQQLSQEEGINLAGIQRILQLREQVEEQYAQVQSLQTQLDAALRRLAQVDRIFAAGVAGEVVPVGRPDSRRAASQRRVPRIAGALLPGRSAASSRDR